MIDFVASWLSLIAQSLVPIGVTVAVLWIVDTRARSLPASYRSWIWRLFFVKCLCIAVLPWYSGLPQLSAISAQFNRVWPSDSASDMTRSDNLSHVDNLSHAENVKAATSGVSTPIPGYSATGDEAGATGDATSPAGTSSPSSRPRMFANWRGWFATRLASDEVLVSLFLVWLLCGSLQLALLGRNYSRMITAVRRGSVASDPRLLQLYRSTARQLGLRQYPPLRLSDSAQGPALVYCGSVKILLPSSFRERFGEQACAMAFAHELGHFVRRDILWNLIATIVAVVFWFYPPVWIALRRYRITMESACDELAVRAARLDRPSYARLLVSLLESPSLPRSSPIMLTMARSESFYSLSERLTAMKNSGHSRGSRMLSAALLTALSVWLLTPWSVADEPTQATPTKPKSSLSQSGSQSGSQLQPFGGGASGGAFAGGSAIAGGSAGGNGFSSGNARVSGGVSVSGNGSDDNKYRSGSQERKNNGMSASFSSSASSSGFGSTLNNGANASGFAGASTMMPNGSQNFSNGNLRSGVNVSTDGDTRISRSMSVVDGERVSSTRIVSKQETITVRESDEDGVEVRVTKRGQRSRDAKVYLADSMAELATEQPEIYESIKKYVATNPADAMGVTADIAAPANQLNPAMQTNPAQQMLVEQLEKMLGEVGDNPQLESMIRQMIRDNQ